MLSQILSTFGLALLLIFGVLFFLGKFRVAAADLAVRHTRSRRHLPACCAAFPLALGIADYAYVLQTGRIALQGKASDLQRNEQVREIYLGLAAQGSA